MLLLLPFGFAASTAQGYLPQTGDANAGPAKHSPTKILAGLWAADPTPAKILILKTGPSIGPNLLAMLKDLVEHRDIPHLIGELDQEPGQDSSDPAAGGDLRGSSDITRRLIDDCVVLLGHLRWAQAAPVITELLESEPLNDAEASCRLETAALKEIGGPAVPGLTAALRNAEITAAGLPSGNVRTVRARLALALIDIGDARAIPALEDLVGPGGEFEGDILIGSAINKMRGNPRK